MFTELSQRAHGLGSREFKSEVKIKLGQAKEWSWGGVCTRLRTLANPPERGKLFFWVGISEWGYMSLSALSHFLGDLFSSPENVNTN